MAIRREPIGDILLRNGVGRAVVEQARLQAEKAGIDLIEGLGRSEGIDSKVLARSLGAQTGMRVLDKVDLDRVDPELIRAVPLGLARETGILPMWLEDDGAVLVALSSPAAMGILDDLRLVYHRSVRPVLVAPSVLRDATNKAYDKASQNASAVMEEIHEDQGDETDDLQLAEDLLDNPNQAPIIRFVNSLLTQATKERASDIHIEPFEKELAVRFRVDGVLYEVVKPPPRLQASIVSRVKIMAGLNIAEKRVPQDGRIRTRMAGREIDIR